MKTQEVLYKLRLLADTIEELEIDNIIACYIDIEGTMSCHLQTLKLTNADCTWIKRSLSEYPWEKTFSHNNIRFFSLHSQKDYKKERG
jgi:hypothetical protein